MSVRSAAPTLSVAGWTVTLLDLGAILAPLTWVFPHADQDATAWLPSNGLLCTNAEECVLVDCGLGPLGDVFDLPLRRVELVEALAAIGRLPADVSTVVLTHVDPDHAGGIVEDDRGRELRPSLPHARVVMLAGALDVLSGSAAERSEPAEAIGVALREAGVRLDGAGDGAEPAPGLRLRTAPGHRAGHACVELSGEGERFVYLADAIHAREHVEHPEWDFLHDSEPEIALATRRGLIDELAGSSAIVACSHVDGLGRIERAADGTPVWVDVA